MPAKKISVAAKKSVAKKPTKPAKASAADKAYNSVTRPAAGVIRQFGAPGSGINLGGMGTGGVELWPDGRFHNWCVANARQWAGWSDDWGEHLMPQPVVRPGDADVFIRIESPVLERPLYRWLFVGYGDLQTTASHFWRHHKYFFIKSVQAIDYSAEYPFVQLDYLDSEIPVKIKLRAFSPFIPRDIKNSSLPGFYLDYTVENLSNVPVKVSVVWQQVNFAGHATPDNKQRHTKVVTKRTTVVHMEGGCNQPDHDTAGGLAMWAKPTKGQKLTSVAANPYMQNLIWSVYRTGGLEGEILPSRLQREEMVESPRKGAPNKGWLCLQQEIAPKSTAEFNFGLAWFFPNHRTTNKTYVGHKYAEWFNNAVEVANYLADNHEKFLAASSILPKSLMVSGLPDALKLSLLDQLNTLTTNTHFTKEGMFGIQEGQGCCAFNTMDVDHYSSYGLSIVQPGIRELVNDMHTKMAHPKNGKMYHGWDTMEREELTVETTNGYNRWDVCCQYVLQVYRDAKWSGNLDLLKRCWPTMKRTMDLIASMDYYRMGLPYTDGGITYDHWRMKGVVGYMAGVYLAALKAMEDAADLLNDEITKETARIRYANGVKTFESVLWNGEQYVLYYARKRPGENAAYKHEGHEGALDPQKPAFTGFDESDGLDDSVGIDKCLGADCCHECDDEDDMDKMVPFEEVKDTGLMTDVLNGQATSVALGLGGFLNDKRVKKQLALTLKRNVRPESQSLVNGTYPDDRFLDEWPFMQWQTPWSGTEFFFALQCYAAGMVSEGDRIIDMVYERHVREGMRFDHSEANNHYARPLCIWGAYTTRLGLEYDGFRDRLTLAPAGTINEYKGALILSTAIATSDFKATAKGASFSMELLDGELALSALSLKTLGSPKKVEVSISGKPAKAIITGTANGRCTLQLSKSAKLKKGSKLSVKLS